MVQSNGGENEPAMGAGDGGLEVFGKAAVAPKPHEGTLDAPAAREQNKAFGLFKTFSF